MKDTIDEKQILEDDYKALKRILGELLLEHDNGINCPQDVAYYSRKFEEARKRLRK